MEEGGGALCYVSGVADDSLFDSLSPAAATSAKSYLIHSASLPPAHTFDSDVAGS